VPSTAITSTARGRQAALQRGGQLLLRRHQAQLAVAVARGVVQLAALVQRALQQAAPGARGPALGHRQQGDVVAVAGIAIEVHAARRLGDGGEHLQADAAGQQARHVGLAVAVALQRIARPQQQVVVQVGHEQPLVQLLRARADGIRRRGGDGIQARIDEAGQVEEHGQRQQHQRGQGDEPLAPAGDGLDHGAQRLGPCSRSRRKPSST
jgi:hypothetical protein